MAIDQHTKEMAGTVYWEFVSHASIWPTHGYPPPPPPLPPPTTPPTLSPQTPSTNRWLMAWANTTCCSQVEPTPSTSPAESTKDEGVNGETDSWLVINTSVTCEHDHHDLHLVHLAHRYATRPLGGRKQWRRFTWEMNMHRMSLTTSSSSHLSACKHTARYRCSQLKSLTLQTSVSFGGWCGNRCISAVCLLLPPWCGVGVCHMSLTIWSLDLLPSDHVNRGVCVSVTDQWWRTPNSSSL